MQWVCHNGFFVLADQPLFTAANRSFKWGDGLFETATFYQGRLLLEAFHFERRSTAQIAGAFELSERAVEGRLRRARQNLRRELEAALDAAGGTP